MQLFSPDRRLSVEVTVTPEGSPYYEIHCGETPVLARSRLGLLRGDADFTRGLTWVSTSVVEAVEDQYQILTAKRRVNLYRANRQVFHLENGQGQKIDVIFQVSNDGVAFRYFFPETDTAIVKLQEEATSFRFPPETRAWLQPMSVAKTFWAETNPAYEEYYEKDIQVGTPSTFGAGWAYPALFRTGETWVLISESSLSANYCATRLRHASPDGEYSVGFPDPREHFQHGPVNPESSLPWLTPWRVIVIGGICYLAGINARTSAQELALDLHPVAPRGSATLITDGDGGNLSFRRETVTVPADENLEITLPAHGGFVMTYDL